ncbi:MAG: asparagine synthase (glutamine-hydrolyzing) [Bacillaceae bacterium]
MCGFVGWVAFDKHINKERNIITQMTETLAKRGPDDTNIWGNEHVLFGHKRLAVVDPIGGKQPMTRKKGEYFFTIAYNGELYNSDDIRDELVKRGYTFESHSDTEVLLNAYIEWREDCVDYLNGIFAFSVYDSQRDHVYIARDRLGVKPLFYAEKNGLLFGSEVKAILKHPTIKAEVASDGLAELFSLGPSRTPGHGIFAGIKELRAGHALTFSRNGLKIWRYWNVESKVHTDSIDETIEQLRFLVNDAVTRQLVSDVPVCTFLSGGLDSSTITAIAAKAFEREGKGTLHTYSIDYEDNSKYFKESLFQPNSDAPWIQLMTETFGTNHHTCVITNEMLADYLEEATILRDLPGMADVDSSLLWFCKEIRKDFVVGLSGECADEIFGGYPWFHKEDVILDRSFPWMRSIDAREQLLNEHWREKLQLKTYMAERYEETVKECPKLEGESIIDARRRDLFYINMQWFMAQLLDRKDRMSMGASLEVRVPFADHRIVEYAWNIPWEMKMYGNREKGLLRKALEGTLPEEILYRKKSPYPKTHHPRYTELVTNWLKKRLENKDSILYEFFNRNQLLELIESRGSSFTVPWYGQLMTGPQLLAYLGQMDVWFEHNRIGIK